MKAKLLCFLIGLLGILSLPVSLATADSPVDPLLCIPSMNILYSDCDRVNGQVFIPVAWPIAGDGTADPSEVLENATVQLQRKSVGPGEDINNVPITLVASSVVDVTTITTVYNEALLIRTV